MRKPFAVLSILITVVSSNALAQKTRLYAEPVLLNQAVRIEPERVNGRFVERITIDNETLTIVDAEPLSKNAEAFANLSEAAQDEIRSIHRDVLTTTLKVVLSGKLTGPMMVQDNRAIRITLPPNYKQQTAVLQVVPVEKFTLNKEKLVHFAKLTGEAVFTSTIDSWKHYADASKEMEGRVINGGLSLNFKYELAMGMAGMTPSKVGGFLIEVGYDRKNRQLVYQIVRRDERQSGGIATPSIKAEIRTYQMTEMPNEEKTFKGHAWYPPAIIPGVSFVFDSAGPYRAQGIVFSATLGDWIGLSLVNTETEFEASFQHRRGFLTVSEPVDMILMTLFRVVWVPVNTAYRVVAPPTTFVFKHAANAVKATTKATAAVIRSCRATITPSN